MERKLASIQTIDKIDPIENADNIEVATILGWKVVIKKGEFSVGDKCCFFEIDSLLPADKPEFEFMAARKFRVKTCKLRGQISQGLALPLNSFSYTDISKHDVGSDVTELLGVEKWEPTEAWVGANLNSRKKGVFPQFLRKTDETRIQSAPRVLYRHKGKQFYYTEKLDGSSITIFYLKDMLYDRLPETIGVCSRNLELKKEEDDPYRNAFWQAVLEADLENKLKTFGRNICIQGELVGAGIQKNKYKLENRKIYLYSAYDVVEQKYLGLKELVDWSKQLELDTVPILGEFTLNHTVDELVEMSKGRSALNTTTIREGIVCRRIDCDEDEELGRASFKVINPNFLLKYDE